ncbi:uncharacterized protein LOC114545459 [Perca flavescens]|uniref:uncharacterized protein LOC114545459 n=1 Tax=Perca flavescens TaxID=8167 RepID=UPI00106E9AE3|nr:uncharacterized protein LOC114545459 [Perca flavescens]
MTLPKSVVCCPVCFMTLMALSHHLKRAHNVHNLEECKLLLNLATGRLNFRKEACPVLACGYHSTRLDKHILDGHRELTRDEVEANQDLVRRTKSISLLAVLRSTNPAVWMATGLNLEEEDEGNLSTVPRDTEEEAPQCPEPSCLNELKVKSLSARLRRMKELSTMRTKSQKLAKRLHRSQAQASGRTGVTSSSIEVEIKEDPPQLIPQQLGSQPLQPPQLHTPQPPQLHTPQPPQLHTPQPPQLLPHIV